MKVFGMTLGGEAAAGEAPGRDRRTAMIGGGVLAAVVLAAGGYLLLGSGSPDDGGTVAAAPVTPRTATSASPTPGASPAPSLETVAAAPARNPFQALVAGSAGGTGADAASTGGTGATTSAPAATGTSDGGTASAPVTEPVTVPDPVTTTEPVPTLPITPPATQPPTADPRVAYQLTLGAIGPLTHAPRPLVWSVDSVEQTVIRGQRFGKYGELVVLSIRPVKKGFVAVLQIGTDSPQVVEVGETITVG